MTCDNLMDVNLANVMEDDASPGSAITIVTITNSAELSGHRIKVNRNLVFQETGTSTSSPTLASRFPIKDIDMYGGNNPADFAGLWQDLDRTFLIRVSSIQPQSWSAFDDVKTLARLDK